ncbi:MAG: DUF4837 family protein [Crocinitomicaceae bacterium]
MKLIYLLFAVCIIPLISCQSATPVTDSEDTPKTHVSSSVSGTLPLATGPIGRVLISVNDNLWGGDMKALFIKHFSKNAKGPYISAEPVLDFFQQDPSKINALGLKNRNILKIIYSPESEITETEVVVKKNYKSQGQIYIVVKDSDKNRLLAFFENELPTYIAVFDSQEDERLINKFAANPLTGFKKAAKDRFGINISVPAKANFETDLDSIIYALDKYSKTFADNPKTGAKGGTYWAKKGILIWDSEIKDESSFTVSKILQERDSTLKYAVKGVVSDSYMATEYHKTHAPIASEIMVGNANAMLIEGLWKHAGNPAASGGGPFLQYAIEHPSNGKIVHVVVYIYALNFNKRELLREAKAILNTIEIIE